ncbi:2-dehydro-3-deoxy-D-gluconate 5-dehydrogenase KduD [Dactylosporangium sucinum]|uniref:2-deoxy-D-gluconate 3-dehydrogenase n=1 Tax=Dactylosporangium sucinum TaxID=1424081 RepID=A0A917SZM3_9ACTN|nr:2-dehydro-3-deoxy-D-gluconate 5-dehydrogenase KduD [Dactylosporangium sucinum]GGM02887.1 2-deoxy-D-gluconate 3-dehydrogenase [Dactylosporangium sucinum]
MTTNALFSLAGRTALVTGASRGIGRAIALGLAAAGSDLILAGRATSNEDTAAEIAALGRGCRIIDVDLADPLSARDAAAAVARDSTVDIVVNNAGIISRDDVLSIAPQDWTRVLDVNLSSLFFLSQQLAAPMVARGRGKLVNVASLLSFQGGIRVAAYTASKHAVAGLTRAMANELGPHGVQVNAIAPGYIATDNTQALRDDPDRFRAIAERIPAGRWGRPEDLVGAAVFLAAAASDYVNGHVLVVDGGWMAR